MGAAAPAAHWHLTVWLALALPRARAAVVDGRRATEAFRDMALHGTAVTGERLLSASSAFDIFLANELCLPGSLLPAFYTEPFDCMQAVAQTAGCSNEFFNHATNTSGVCGCVRTGVDCSQPSNRQSTMYMWIYRTSMYSTITLSTTRTVASTLSTGTTATAPLASCLVNKIVTNAGIAALMHRGWWFQPPSLLFCLLLLVHILMVAVAVARDTWRSLLGGRSGFLVEPQDGAPYPSYCALMCGKVSLRPLMNFARSQDVADRWRPLQVATAKRTSRLFGAAALGVDIAELHVIRRAARHHLEWANNPKFATMPATRLSTGVQEEERQVSWRTELLTVHLELEAMLHTSTQVLFSPQTPFGIRFALFIAALHPWAAVSRRGCCTPTAVFSALAMVSDMGSMALTAAFFSATARDGTGCELEMPAPAWLCQAAIGILATMVNSVPVSVLTTLALGSRIVHVSSCSGCTLLQLCWAWLLTCLVPVYAGLCTLYVAVFLANVEQTACRAWLCGAIAILLARCILQPTALALAYAGASGALLRRPEALLAVLGPPGVGAAPGGASPWRPTLEEGPRPGEAPGRSLAEVFKAVAQSEAVPGLRPAVSPKRTPNSSLRGSPRTSPRASPRTSPRGSRRGSPRNSPRNGSPQSSWRARQLAGSEDAWEGAQPRPRMAIGRPSTPPLDEDSPQPASEADFAMHHAGRINTRFEC